MITINTIEEATCSECGCTWIIRDEEDRHCPECRRKSSVINHVMKSRHLCLFCHNIWLTSAFAHEHTCPKCGTADRPDKRMIAVDTVDVYECGSCGHEWQAESMSWERVQDPWGGEPILIQKFHSCPKCGCGQEEAYEKREAELARVRKRKSRGWTMTSYRGHTQTTDPDTGELRPSCEEIDAKIATGIWKEERPMITRWLSD